MNPVCVRHWTEGGNYLTAFTSDNYEAYCQAIEQHGDSRLAIFEGPGIAPAGILYQHWLIWMSKDPIGDLSAFWDTYHKIQQTRKTQ